MKWKEIGKTEVEYKIGKEMVSILRDIKSDFQMYDTCGNTLFGEEAEQKLQWDLGRVEGIKLALRYLLDEKGVDYDRFASQLKPGPMPKRFIN